LELPKCNQQISWVFFEYLGLLKCKYIMWPAAKVGSLFRTNGRSESTNGRSEDWDISIYLETVQNKQYPRNIGTDMNLWAPQ
jgi:hypothetical protein